MADVDAPKPINAAPKSEAPKTNKDADLAEAMKKMEALKKEIERIKSES